jgi:hypothetical protein
MIKRGRRPRSGMSSPPAVIRLPWGIWPAYRCFVYLGVIAGAAYARGLARLAGVSAAVTLALAALGVLTAVGLGLAWKVARGGEGFTFYHHQIAVLAVAALVLGWAGRPVLPYLDVLVLTLGTVQAFGRVGCLLAGCCHGRPWRWGVCYGEEHAAQGFGRALVGVRLFPVQAVESACLFVLVAAASSWLSRRPPPGEVLAGYVIVYGGLRFALELLRGDDARPYRLGFSEAQWTSLACMTALAGAEAAGLVPPRLWHLASPAALALAMLVIAGARRARPAPLHRWLHPRHIGEIAALLAGFDGGALPAGRGPAPAGQPLQLGATSLGIKLSYSRSPGAPGGDDGAGVHYALSAASGELSRHAAEALARLILRLRPPAQGRREGPAAARLVPGRGGVFHLLIGPGSMRAGA